MFKLTTISSVVENVTFNSITWPELLVLAQSPHKSRALRPEVAKKRAPLVAAHNGKTRNKQQAEASLFGLLRADLDDAKGQSPEDIGNVLREQGLTSWLIYSTLSHTLTLPRYRVLVELAEPIPFYTWADLQFALTELLESDSCVVRPAQFMILPTTINSTVEHYQFLIGEGEPLNSSGAFWLKAMKQAAQHQAEVMQQKHEQTTPKQFTERLVGNQVSIIDLVNRSYEWPELLLHYGYKRSGRNSWIAPESTSGTAGVYILTSSTDGKERIYSHHQSDPAGHRLCDKFDLIAIRQFGGNYFKAIAVIASDVFPEVHKHNFREWVRTQSNKCISAARLGPSHTEIKAHQPAPPPNEQNWAAPEQHEGANIGCMAPAQMKVLIVSASKSMEGAK